jgi:copper chaperone
MDYPKKLLHVTFDSSNPSLVDRVAMNIENAGYTVEWGKEGFKVKYYKIDGMYCSHCVGTVERVIQPIRGVKNVLVNLDRHIATVIVDSSFKSEEFIEAISGVGYEASPYEGSRDIYLRIDGMVLFLLLHSLSHSVCLSGSVVRNSVQTQFTMLFAKWMASHVFKLISILVKLSSEGVLNLKILLLQLSKLVTLPSQ